MPLPGPANSPDGFRRAVPQPYGIAVSDSRWPPNNNAWPLPDAAERRRYHTTQAAKAEQQNQWFAAAFHLGRLLLDAPNDANLKCRRDAALRAAPSLSRSHRRRWRRCSESSDLSYDGWEQLTFRDVSRSAKHP